MGVGTRAAPSNEAPDNMDEVHQSSLESEDAVQASATGSLVCSGADCRRAHSERVSCDSFSIHRPGLLYLEFVRSCTLCSAR